MVFKSCVMAFATVGFVFISLEFLLALLRIKGASLAFGSKIDSMLEKNLMTNRLPTVAFVTRFRETSSGKFPKPRLPQVSQRTLIDTKQHSK
jgi:hypothetical protein